MPLLLAAGPDQLSQIARIITVAVLLAGVLLLTGFTTRWLAGFEKGRLKGRNIELLEAMSLGSKKYVQILRVGNKFLALAVCRDSVTFLCELKEEDLKVQDMTGEKGGFGTFLRAAVKRTPEKEGVSTGTPPVSRELKDSLNIEAGETDH